MNIPSQNSEIKNKFLTHKRERIMSETSQTSETNNENNDIPLTVIRPNIRYPDSKDQLPNKPDTLFLESKRFNQLNETRIVCNCKNSQCLKFYCECFSQMLYCDPKVCSCKNCMNNEANYVL